MSIKEWIVSSPYSEDQLAFMQVQEEKRRTSNRVYEPIEYGEWLVETTKQFMKGTWLEQDFVPMTPRLGRYSFGYDAGGSPVFCFETSALHEIGHAIQLKKSQYNHQIKHSNRFKHQRSSVQTIIGRQYYEPLSMEPTLCEAEAIGISLVLLEVLGYKIDHKLYYDTWAETLQYNPDSPNGGKQRILIVTKMIEMFYLMWNSQQDLMEIRYKNYCKYVNQLALEEAKNQVPAIKAVRETIYTL